jgi:putative transposase
MGRYLVSVKRACRCVRLHRSAWYYRSHPDPQTELRQRVRDFVADQLADGRKIRTLTILDLYTRKCLGIEVGLSLRAEDAVIAMNLDLTRFGGQFLTSLSVF